MPPSEQMGIYTPCLLYTSSRFISEIPEEYLEKSGRSLYDQTREYGGSWRDSSWGRGDGMERTAPRREGGYTRPDAGEGRPRRKVSYGTSTVGSARMSGGKVDLQKGEMVTHDAFGQGMVISVTPMGGDALLEIAFDNVGTKRLMYKSASAHLKKNG